MFDYLNLLILAKTRSAVHVFSCCIYLFMRFIYTPQNWIFLSRLRSFDQEHLWPIYLVRGQSLNGQNPYR